MIRRPPRSTPLYSSAASDVYKRQWLLASAKDLEEHAYAVQSVTERLEPLGAVSYTHLRAHETDSYLVCRLLLEKKKKNTKKKETKKNKKQTRNNKDKIKIVE